MNEQVFNNSHALTQVQFFAAKPMLPRNWKAIVKLGISPALIFSVLCKFSVIGASAQVTEVVVGITPTCPYGISACSAVANEALGQLEDVESVAKIPDSY